MNKKVQTVYTSRMMNTKAHESRKAARKACRALAGLDQYNAQKQHNDLCYINIGGIMMPMTNNF